MKTTLNRKQKTNPGMLPQSQALRVAAADKPRSARNGRQQTARVQPVRGEIKPAHQNAERGVTRTFVLSKAGHPLMPCSNARARILVRNGRAKVYRLFPFTIQFIDRVSGDVQPVAIKFDPGANTTGVAIVREEPEDPTKQSVLHLAEITHRGQAIRKHMIQRAMFKRRRRCAYCDAEGIPLEAEHIVPKVCGGSKRVSNLTLACRKCNQRKGSQPIHAFLADDPSRMLRILSHTKKPLSSAAAVNVTRKAINRVLYATGLEVQCSSGGRTKFNRSQLAIPKTHALDAACVGELSQLEGWNVPIFCIKATGRGSYQRTRLDSFGFPRGYLTRQKAVKGFQTGDLVKATIPRGKFKGAHRGRLAVRARGSFVIQTSAGNVETNWKHCKRLMRNDGYTYTIKEAFRRCLKEAVPSRN